MTYCLQQLTSSWLSFCGLGREPLLAGMAGEGAGGTDLRRAFHSPRRPLMSVGRLNSKQTFDEWWTLSRTSPIMEPARIWTRSPRLCGNHRRRGLACRSRPMAGQRWWISAGPIFARQPDGGGGGVLIVYDVGSLMSGHYVCQVMWLHRSTVLGSCIITPCGYIAPRRWPISRTCTSSLAISLPTPAAVHLAK